MPHVRGRAETHQPGAVAPGFSLVEVLVAAAIALCLLAALLGAAADAQRASVVQSEIADLGQRLRTGTSALVADLERAGAGAPLGCVPGPLHRYLAPIRPYRIGLWDGQPPGTFDPDAISLVAVPADAPVAALGAPLAAALALVPVVPTSGSHATSSSLGFTQGMAVAVVDADTVADLYRVTATGPGTLELELMAGAVSGAHPPGACVVQVEVTSYALAPDAVTGSFTINRYDGYKSDLPVVDHVVGLTFGYFGEPRAPRLTRHSDDPTGPWTTYGPRPPPSDVDNPRDSWPVGESCLFAAGSPIQPPRLPDLGASSGGLVPLDGAMLTDGPWCPDAGLAFSFDADLLRIRRVTVSIRLESPVAFLRGPVGPLFARPGPSGSGALLVPDRSVIIDVAPRNLGVDR